MFSKSSKSFNEKVGKLEEDSFKNPEKNIDYLLSANQQSNSKVFKDSFKSLFFLFLSLLVVVHEAGHFSAAKIFKVYCEECGRETEVWLSPTSNFQQ